MNNLDSFFSPDIVYFTLEEGLRFMERFCRYVFKATKIDHAAILRKIPMLPDESEGGDYDYSGEIKKTRKARRT